MDVRLLRVNDRVLELTTLLGADMSSTLESLGLSQSRAHILWVLAESGPCTQRDLAQALDVAPRTVTGLVDGLVASGHVTREPHPGDRRATLVTPTDTARAITEDFARGREQMAEELFGWLDDDGLRALDDTLREVNRRLQLTLAQQTPREET